MNKSIKGVMPANPAKKKATNESKPEEKKDNSSFKPIKKIKPGTKLINTMNTSESKTFRTPSDDELSYITDIIVEKLMQVFVPRAEVKEVVEKTLQEMVANGTNVSKK